MEMPNGTASVENSWTIPKKKLNIELSCDPLAPFLHIYPNKLKMRSQTETCGQY
jgi:hypothetical protein